MEQPSGTSGTEPPYVPKVPRSNPNISDTPPLKEFAQVGAIVLGGVLLLYWLLGSMAGCAASRIPYDLERKLTEGVALHKAFEMDDAKFAAERLRLQDIVDEMSASLGDQPLQYTVHIVDDPMVNAAALPGGHILVFRGLLSEAESENEIAMILGHEIGHLVHRDHLRALGRRAVLVFMASALGASGAAEQLLVGSMDTLDRSFNRGQEQRADEIGVQLLVEHYGHGGGATDFFARHAGDSEGLELFATHPLSDKRVAAIEAWLTQRGAPERETVPWNP